MLEPRASSSPMCHGLFKRMKVVAARARTLAEVVLDCGRGVGQMDRPPARTPADAPPFRSVAVILAFRDRWGHRSRQRRQRRGQLGVRALAGQAPPSRRPLNRSRRRVARTGRPDQLRRPRMGAGLTL